MGRTIPSFRWAHMAEERQWKAFRDALGRKERKKFDEIFATSRLYLSACSYSARTVRIQPIFMAVVFHHYKQLIRIAERMEDEEGERPAP